MRPLAFHLLGLATVAASFLTFRVLLFPWLARSMRWLGDPAGVAVFHAALAAWVLLVPYPLVRLALRRRRPGSPRAPLASCLLFPVAAWNLLCLGLIGYRSAAPMALAREVARNTTELLRHREWGRFPGSPRRPAPAVASRPGKPAPAPPAPTPAPGEGNPVPSPGPGPGPTTATPEPAGTGAPAAPASAEALRARCLELADELAARYPPSSLAEALDQLRRIDPAAAAAPEGKPRRVELERTPFSEHLAGAEPGEQVVRLHEKPLSGGRALVYLSRQTLLARDANRLAIRDEVYRWDPEDTTETRLVPDGVKDRDVHLLDRWGENIPESLGRHRVICGAGAVDCELLSSCATVQFWSPDLPLDGLALGFAFMPQPLALGWLVDHAGARRGGTDLPGVLARMREERERAREESAHGTAPLALPLPAEMLRRQAALIEPLTPYFTPDGDPRLLRERTKASPSRPWDLAARSRPGDWVIRAKSHHYDPGERYPPLLRETVVFNDGTRLVVRVERFAPSFFVQALDEGADPAGIVRTYREQVTLLPAAWKGARADRELPVETLDGLVTAGTYGGESRFWISERILLHGYARVGGNPRRPEEIFLSQGHWPPPEGFSVPDPATVSGYVEATEVITREKAAQAFAPDRVAELAPYVDLVRRSPLAPKPCETLYIGGNRILTAAILRKAAALRPGHWAISAGATRKAMRADSLTRRIVMVNDGRVLVERLESYLLDDLEAARGAAAVEPAHVTFITHELPREEDLVDRLGPPLGSIRVRCLDRDLDCDLLQGFRIFSAEAPYFGIVLDQFSYLLDAGEARSLLREDDPARHRAIMPGGYGMDGR